MKRTVAAVLTLLILIPCFSSIASTLDAVHEHSLGFFTYELPSWWVASDANEQQRTHSSLANGGTHIYVISHKLPQTNMLGTRELAAKYKELTQRYLKGGGATRAVTDKPYPIAGGEGRIMGYNARKGPALGGVAVGILLHGEGALIVTYVSESIKAQDAVDQLLPLLDSVKYTGPFAFVAQAYGKFEFRTVARKPSAYLGQRVKIRGTIVQAMGTAKDGFELRVATRGKYDDIIYVTTKPDLPENLLEGDVLDLYCELTGELTYSSVFGSSITLPSAKLEFYTIK